MFVSVSLSLSNLQWTKQNSEQNKTYTKQTYITENPAVKKTKLAVDKK